MYTYRLQPVPFCCLHRWGYELNEVLKNALHLHLEIENFWGGSSFPTELSLVGSVNPSPYAPVPHPFDPIQWTDATGEAENTPSAKSR